MLSDFIPEMFWRQHFNFASVGKNLLHKIICRREVVAEHRVVFFSFNLFLGMMQRQRPEIFPLYSVYFQIYKL